MSKRTRDEIKLEQEEAAKSSSSSSSSSSTFDSDDESDDEQSTASNPQAKKQRVVCPYLDTINREMLEFDFSKQCSVTLSNLNVYCCLICGKYLQGRGRQSQVYYHSLHENHHLFINLNSAKVFCLPDDYEVIDRSLDDLKFLLNPSFTVDEVKSFDTASDKQLTDLEGNEFIQGVLGMNNIKATDYLAVVLQSLVRIRPLRNFFMFPNNYAKCKSKLVDTFGHWIRSYWNPRRFRSHNIPHRLYETISETSNQRFRVDQQGDPLEFLSWFLNALHLDLTNKKRGRSSIIHKVFQGEVEITT
eukprot:TRINITY_DN5894_c0_g1_i2.p1 TRINITY_DN5894_c0_g1~~TRINITY_DN5894_c0_g1_i2.p1  ORF type:complete len:302 (+),score=89.50 TRINITY_DN5894_c0_g1_i2:53-958(+)